MFFHPPLHNFSLCLPSIYFIHPFIPYLFFNPSIYPSLYSLFYFTHPSLIHFSIQPSVHPSILFFLLNPSIPPSIYSSLQSFFTLSTHPSIHSFLTHQLTRSFVFNPSNHPFFSIHPSTLFLSFIHLFIHSFFNQFIHPSSILLFNPSIPSFFPQTIPSFLHSFHPLVMLSTTNQQIHR